MQLDEKTRFKLDMAITEYDRRESTKAHYNPNGLGLMFKRLQEYVIPEMAAGSTLAQALYDNFNDRLLTALEKACGLPVTYGGGKQSKGRPTY